MPTDVVSHSDHVGVIFPRASLCHVGRRDHFFAVVVVVAPAAQWTPAWELLYVPVAVIKLNGLELLSSWQAVFWLSEVSLVQGAIWMGFLSTMSVPRNLLLRSIHKKKRKKKRKMPRHYFPHLSLWYGCQSKENASVFFSHYPLCSSIRVCRCTLRSAACQGIKRRHYLKVEFPQ